MALQDKKEELESQKEKIPAQEQSARFEQEKTPEKREVSKEDRIVSAELRAEIEKMDLDEKGKAEAEKKAEKIGFLGEEEKIKHLLQIAREKGVVFAIHVARQMNEPYLLDILHDTLAQEGLYKDFMKKK